MRSARSAGCVGRAGIGPGVSAVSTSTHTEAHSAGPDGGRDRPVGPADVARVGAGQTQASMGAGSIEPGSIGAVTSLASVRSERTTGGPIARRVGVIALQRMAGNRAVGQLLAAPERQGPVGADISVQRDDPPAATDERTPTQRVDDATFRGFTVWAESATADADEALTASISVADALGSPYQGRLNMLIGDVTGDANTLDWGLVALREGREAPSLTADARGFVDRFEHRLEALQDVTEAWQAVTSSAVMTLIGMIAEAQVARARALKQELDSLVAQLRDLQRIAEGGDLRGAFVQLGVNTAITGVLLAISFANPLVGIAVAVGSAAVQCGLDELLGPSGNDAVDAVSVGLGIGGSAMEARAASKQLAGATSKLGVAGKRLGLAGAALGTALDVLETREAIAAYEDAQARIGAISTRLERVSRQLTPLRPILEFPATAAKLVQRIQSQAAVLRENAQIVLKGRGQL